ncbi:uncharacterized protein FOMMEDRAFT_155869 [Fomitiporia mediterranea MF3/22]|uniref:uncharacterized protein n=1 Tax=Fomitiporia mediterranea (strain MF3/22) TaxID=694068 RepID=UPI0004407A7D|nr:uncharacterized protein FOMMEDRAFT_155869 [Fomitiporia mediterranea MF3/22]EJD02577.1 hypothetical protein FOMMEDRAFT_155869 [Fomitiporia mediterranea MF3/22]
MYAYSNAQPRRKIGNFSHTLRSSGTGYEYIRSSLEDFLSAVKGQGEAKAQFAWAHSSHSFPPRSTNYRR